MKSLAALLLAGLCLLAQADIAPEAATGRSQLKSASGQHWMAVTANPYATDTAAAILAAGGTALDAAIAAQLVLGLVEPQSSGIGGGAFLLYWQADKQQLHYYDGRETAPAALKPDHFIADNGRPMAFFDAVVGGHAVGVPGLLRMLDMAHQEHGTMPWPALLQPAIRLASDGFIVSPRLHGLLQDVAGHAPTMRQQAFVDYFFVNGQPRPVGSRLKNPAYAATLQRLADDGIDAFYSGALATQIVDAVQHNPLRPGLLAKADMAGYQARRRPPLCKPVQGWQLCGAAPPASGPLAVMQVLALLQALPDASEVAAGSAAFYHRFAEALKRAMADRDRYLADPDVVRQPLAALLDDGYLAQRAKGISLTAASVEVAAGVIDGFSHWQASPSPELPSTSHLSIVDRDGNIVSMTSSIEMAFGSRIMVGGFLLNNQLTDFSFVERANGQPVANRAEAGKRPRSSMAPMLVLDQRQQPQLVIGSPGGSRIISYVAKTLAQHLYYGATPGQAMESPQLSHHNGVLYLEKSAAGQPLQAALEAFGHRVQLAEQASGLHLIVRQPDGWQGLADSRREGTAAGR